MGGAAEEAVEEGNSLKNKLEIRCLDELHLDCNAEAFDSLVKQDILHENKSTETIQDGHGEDGSDSSPSDDALFEDKFELYDNRLNWQMEGCSSSLQHQQVIVDSDSILMKDEEEKRTSEDGMQCTNIEEQTFRRTWKENFGADKNRQIIIAEIQSFLEDMRQKSTSRLQLIEKDRRHIDDTTQVESEKIKKGLEAIETFDKKLQQLENKCANSVVSDDWTGSLESKDTQSSAWRSLRRERKKRRRVSKIRRALQSIDMSNAQMTDHISRNILLGPNARYFTLTPEEDALVEEILQQPDTYDESDVNSVSSKVSTAFDLDTEEASRLAEIDARLEHYKWGHQSAGSMSPMLSKSSQQTCPSASPAPSDSPPSPIYISGDTNKKESDMPSEEFSQSIQQEVVAKALNQLVMTTAVDDYLAERKDMREFQAKCEEIERRLRQLKTAELCYDMSEDDVARLVQESKKEIEMEMHYTPSLRSISIEA